MTFSFKNDKDLVIVKNYFVIVISDKALSESYLEEFIEEKVEIHLYF